MNTSGMSHASSIGSDISLRQISALNVIITGLLIAGTIALGSMFLPLWLLIVLAAIVGLGMLFIQHIVLLLPIYIFATIIRNYFQYISDSSNIILPFKILFLLITVFFIAERLIKHKRFSVNTYHLSFNLFIVFSLIVGAVHLCFGTTKIDTFFLDPVFWFSLTFLPALYMLIGINTRAEKYFFRFMLCMWLMVFVLAILKIRMGFGAAVYMYEVSFARFDITNAAMMFFIFFSFILYETRTKKLLMYLGSLMITIAGILLTFNRTTWLAVPACSLIIVALASKQERKKALKISFIFIVVVILAVIVINQYYPIVSILLKYLYKQFTTSSNLQTDPSLFNRYIEWAHVWKTLILQPITGYGAGGVFHNYNWLLGKFIDQGYIHNGFLGMLFKGGIVGFILVMFAFIGFFLRSCVLAVSKVLQPRERIMARAAAAYLILIAVNMLTQNIFSHREILQYLGVCWGYIACLDAYHFKLKREQVHTA